MESKRAHKHSYNATSGVGIIIGISQEKHQCYKNWDESSSQMETDIIVEGFVKAEATHGVNL